MGVETDEQIGFEIELRFGPRTLKVDCGPLTVIKQINVGAPSVQTTDKHDHDRQPADGEYVYIRPAGRHDISLVLHQVESEEARLEACYVNLQAIPLLK